ncbi:MAG: Hpt domain-containing protein [Rhizobiaceae bacterium]|nr:Hpt domain-containing protein [Rhizobiaceae bacterium]
MAMQQEFFEAPQHSLKCNPSRARPIDLVHLARSTRGNKETETTVLGLFARQARQCVNQLCETGQGTKNADPVAAVQALRGSASNVGAFCVSHAAESLEKDPRDQLLNEALTDAVVEVENFISGLSR